MSCSHPHRQVTTRRELLGQFAGGFGAVALTALFGERAWGQVVGQTTPLPARIVRSVTGSSALALFAPKPEMAACTSLGFAAEMAS